MTATAGRPTRPETANRYLETIWCIAAEGESVRASRIAHWLDVSAPTVTVALRRLVDDGWVEISADRSIALTAAGGRLAAEVVRRHRILERWLTDVLGFDWATADLEAERLFPAVSDAVLDRLDASMHRPSTCPHGNPVPGRTPPYGHLVRLADLAVDTVASVRRVSEIAEHEAPHVLRQLADSGVNVGSEVTVAARPDERELIGVAVGNRTLDLPAEVARLVWVEPAG